MEGNAIKNSRKNYHLPNQDRTSLLQALSALTLWGAARKKGREKTKPRERGERGNACGICTKILYFAPTLSFLYFAPLPLI